MSVPKANPGILSSRSALIKPEYFPACLAGITASPGESIAGIISPAPLGPGSERMPSASFLGAMNGLYLEPPGAAGGATTTSGLTFTAANPRAATAALWYAPESVSRAVASEVNA